MTTLKDNAAWMACKPFLNGGLSGMGATVVIQPIDIVKVNTGVPSPGKWQI